MIQKYYWEHVITDSIIENCIEIVDKIFETDNWCKDDPNIPKYQTWTTLFEIDEFYPFAETFMQSCSYYLNIPKISYEKVVAWMYKSDATTTDAVWHNHAKGGCHLSGLFYLKNDEMVGTEFRAVPGILPEKYCWYIFPSFLDHKPQQNKTNNKKYCLAADLTLDF